jgi:sugar/nucleoside kinase (ribokinase family)
VQFVQFVASPSIAPATNTNRTDMTQHEAIVAGHLCLDIIPSLSGAAPAPGRMVEAGPALLATGGAVSNTGVALHRLGVATRLIGKVGDDLFGQAIRQKLESYGAGLAEGLVVAPGETSSYTVILNPPGLDRAFVHHPGCNTTFAAADVSNASLAGARLLHLGYPPLLPQLYANGGFELTGLLRRAKSHGLTTSLDMTMPDPNSTTGRADWQAVLAATLPLTDVFMPSVEELLLMLDRPAFDTLAAGTGPMVDRIPAARVAALADELLAYGPAVVGLKCGHRGMMLRTADAERLAAMGHAAPAHVIAWADRTLWAPCFAVEVAGTTGAGDATCAGFLMALLRGFALEDALDAASAVGACCVEAADALSGIQSWPATIARLLTGWPRCNPDIASEGWRQNERGLWEPPNTQR